MMIDALLVATLTPMLWFVGRYVSVFRWWDHWEGRALVIAGIGWSLLLGGLLINRHTDAVSDGIWVIVGVVIALGAWLKVVTIERAIRESRGARNP